MRSSASSPCPPPNKTISCWSFIGFREIHDAQEDLEQAAIDMGLLDTDATQACLRELRAKAA
jgi:hypothetical protein